MTDDPAQSGWWQASDGKWYPPETRIGAPPAAPAPAPAAEIPAIQVPAIQVPPVGPPTLSLIHI